MSVIAVDGTRKLCQRLSNRYGSSTSGLWTKHLFGLEFSSSFKLRTFRLPCWSCGVSSPPTGDVLLALYTADEDYMLDQLVTSYIYPNIENHENYYNFSYASMYYWDVWITIPSGSEFDIDADTRYAILLEPAMCAEHCGGGLNHHNREQVTGTTFPSNMPGSLTSPYKNYYKMVSGEWVELTAYTPNLVIYPLEVEGYTYPTNNSARVSAIRRIFHPGLYRMEIALGDLGFEWDVSEVAMRKVEEGVVEPEEPEEEKKDMPTREEIDEARRRFRGESWPKAMESAGEIAGDERPIVSGKWTAPAPGPPTIPGLNNYVVTFPDGRKVIVAAKNTTDAIIAAEVPLWQRGLVTVRKM